MLTSLHLKHNLNFLDILSVFGYIQKENDCLFRQPSSSINNMKHKKITLCNLSLAPPSGLEPETP